jgi:hypothetical protein
MPTEETKLDCPHPSLAQALEELAEIMRGRAAQDPPRQLDLPRLSFSEQLRASAEAARNAGVEDPWEPALRRLKGRIGHDGIERVSTHDVFDVLEVPMRRRPSENVRLSRAMRRLGWTNIRARGLNPGSYRDRVRGYAREVPAHPATIRRPNEF